MSSSIRKLRKLRKYTLGVGGCNSEHKAAGQCLLLSITLCVYIAKGLKNYCNVFRQTFRECLYDKLLLPDLSIPALKNKEFV